MITTGAYEKFKAWRRERIIKAAGLTPGRVNLPNAIAARLFHGDYTLGNSELLFSAVSRIANALSTMPLQLYKGSTAIYNDLNEIVCVQPNDHTVACQFYKAMEACRCTYGNAYALKVYDEHGNFDHLDILDPVKVTPVLEKESGALWFRVTPEQGREMYINNFYMIHIPFISTNGYIGVNPVSVLFDTISYSESIQKFSVAQLEKGVNAAVVLEAPSQLSSETQKRMIEDFTKTYKETSGNILLLESGVIAKSLNLSPVDSKLFEVEKITRSKVAMVFNLPPHLLGDYSATSFSSQEQQMLEFLSLTMLPIVTAYEQELNYKLLNSDLRRKGYHFKFDMNSVLRADASTMAEVNYKAVRSGWKTPDEIRGEYSLPPYKGDIGKHPMISQDLATLDYTVRVKPNIK